MSSNIRNVYERLVIEHVQSLLAKNGLPIDMAYFEDIACVALNYLPSRYVRHLADLSSHLTDAEREAMTLEVADAVNFAIATTQRRRKSRSEDPA